MSAILETHDLVVAYGGNQALAVPHLAVARGELVGVVGANGAGKSTLVNSLLGWSRGRPRITGKVILEGQDISLLPSFARVRKGLLLIPEGKLIFGTMSVAENLASASIGAVPDGRKAYSVEEIYDLFPRLKERRGHLGSQLSGGERQMLGIARALRLGPSALLLDEPSIGLAPRLVATVLQTVRQLADDGLAVLLVEQNVSAAIEVVDRLVLLERGSVIAEGPAATMRDDPRIAEAYLGAHAA
ncbi:branched-chain amino acid ABC transporter ATP-binding protein [Bosea sp. AAP35]|uniref:ABC transporter ATP-binding protein n=1 Tax=Bosea sp. AAP35 TaxID=1523417 RepID=UPI0006B9C5A1|nr:ABC transporter ATP-binding protein [Bosea sp. AAP35]KPF72425.1 branched-chain amino acid ABC transporter ATP-binding protein [Bosea sp. AAP35]